MGLDPHAAEAEALGGLVERGDGGLVFPELPEGVGVQGEIGWVLDIGFHEFAARAEDVLEGEAGGWSWREHGRSGRQSGRRGRELDGEHDSGEGSSGE